MQSAHLGSLDRRHGLQGFTILEAAVAAALLIMFASSALAGIGYVNRLAMISRLQTAAMVLAQQRIDEIHAVPWRLNDPRPTILAGDTTEGEVVEGTVTNVTLPLNNDPTFSTANSLTARPRKVCRITDIEDVAVPAGQQVRQVRATVTVSYIFRDRPYSVTMRTLRASNSF